MKRELGLLNVLCVLAAILFIGLALLNAITSGEFLTTDNLFITMVCLVMALMFVVNPLLYLKSEGRLPIPFLNKLPGSTTPNAGTAARAVKPAATAPALLDAKGRPVPHDVRQIVANLGQAPAKDSQIGKIGLDEIAKKVLGMFKALGKSRLDLHELFEAGGNDPQARTEVFDTVERLVTEGLLEELGNDFYSLTEKGKKVTGSEI